MQQIPFIDLQAQKQHLGSRIDDAIIKVLAHGKYIMGPEVRQLEKHLERFSGAKHAISCSNGTDAILMPLMAWGIGAGDAVFCPSFTFASTAEAVAFLGATPVFVDVEAASFNLDTNSLYQAIKETIAKDEFTPKAIIAVDLFGQIADYPKIKSIADEFGLKIISDAAQGFGSTLDGEQALKWADALTTSFFPAKPLGCYGDGGAVLSNSDEDTENYHSIRVHGKGTEKYDNVRVGMNARLDTIQAAILIEKLDIFSDEIVSRNVIARKYNEELANVVKVPNVPQNTISTWAQYTILVDDREALSAFLKERGIPSAVYYPKPLHKQTAYKSYPLVGNGLPISEELSGKVLSLPMHPYMEEKDQAYIIASILEHYSK